MTSAQPGATRSSSGRQRSTDDSSVAPMYLGPVLGIFIFSWTLACYMALRPDPTSLNEAAAVSWFAAPLLLVPALGNRGPLVLANPWTVVFGLFVHGWAAKMTFASHQASTVSATTAADIASSGLGRGVAIGLVGLVSLAAGYGLASLRRPGFRVRLPPRLASFDQRESWSIPTLTIAAVVVLGVAAVAAALFYISGPGLSGKRFNDVQGGAAGRVGTQSYLFLRLSYLGHSVFIVLLLFRYKFGKLPNVLLKVMLPIAFLVALSGPLIANSRSGIVLVLIDLLMIQTILSGRIRPGRLVLGVVLAAVASAQLLTVRSESTTGLQSGLSALLTGRDLFDLGKLTHIVALPPGMLGLQSLVGWTVFPFPESWLPFPKPLWTALGQYVWTYAYPHPPGVQNGVPAGLIGELYLNLGLVAIIPGMALFGLVVGLLQRRLIPLMEERSVLGAVLFSAGLLRFVVLGLSNDLGTGFWSAATDALPILVLLLVVTRSRPDGPLRPTRRGRGASTRRGRRGTRAAQADTGTARS